MELLAVAGRCLAPIHSSIRKAEHLPAVVSAT